MLDDEISVRAIAKYLGFHQSAIYREIKRGTMNGVYNPENSEERYQNQLRKCGKEAIISANPKLAQAISDYILKDHLSPEKIIEALKERADEFPETPKSCNTIYNAIDNGLIPKITRDSLRSEETTVHNNGNVFLATWLREELGIKDGDTLHFEVTEDKKIIFTKIEDSN
jgi:IS30 family transposase